MTAPSNELDSLLNALADAESGDANESIQAIESRLAEILRADASARKRYRQFLELHSALMWDYAAAATEREPVKSSSWFASSAWRKAILALAAVIVIAALFAAFWTRSSRANPRIIARLDSATGAVSWSDDGGSQRAGLASGATISSGTLIVEGASGSAQLRFNDGTVLTLTGDAEVGFSDDGQKRLVLRRGAFTAHVARQPAGKPMIVRTTTAEIEVIGTVFALASEPNQTALNVESGSVRLRRLADGHAVDVPANRLAIATLDVRAEMQSRPQSIPPTEWHRTFEPSPSPACMGQWIAPSNNAPGRLRSLPFVAGRAVDGRLVIHHGIAVRAGAGEGLVTLKEGSRLHVRYRTERVSGLKLFLSCERAEGTFGGNFELALNPVNGAEVPGGWITTDVPLSPLHALMSEEPSIGGKRLRTLILHSYESEAGLEVAEIGISQPLPQ